MVKETFKKFIEKIFLPGWLIFFTDMAVIGFVYMFTYLLRYNLDLSAVDIPKILKQMTLVMPAFALAEYILKPYQGILRHSSVEDAAAVIKTVLAGTFGLLLITLAGRQWNVEFMIPWSVVISQFFICIALLIGFRFLAAYTFQWLVRIQSPRTHIMIFGAGDIGMMTKGILERDKALEYQLVGYIDDNPMLQHKKVEGVMVYPMETAFSRIIGQKHVSEIIICISQGNITKERKSRFVDACIENNIRVKEIPGVKEWLDGRFYASQIHDVLIEDLLGRDPIDLEDGQVRKGVHGKRILVTGAAGSIGSEIVRQLSRLYPSSLVLVDQAESALFDLHHEITRDIKGISLRIAVADVTDLYHMKRIMSEEKPDIVFHASAYKHVPLMEQQPYEAIRTNILGTKTIADLSVEFSVGKFVMVSTDKAVNPTNIMGASKRICELYTQCLTANPGVTTQFITTRFGNVLGSSGSVIPLFRKQISIGGPVTVTHKEIYRYFMTIPEACQLVLEAGFMGNGGEIFIFDMGKPVKIYDLAEKMIRLSGFTPHKDIQIVETGLRPGEKLFEELLTKAEETLPTHHSKILVAKNKPYHFEEIRRKIDELLTHLSSEEEERLILRMKDIVPEFVSRNSRFEVLDLRKES